MSKKLSDYKNEKAAAILADILEPASEIFSDRKFTDSLQKSPVSAAKIALKNHGKEVIDILSVYDCVPREEYNVNPMQILSKLIAILNDKDLMGAFISQEQKTEN